MGGGGDLCFFEDWRMVIDRATQGNLLFIWKSVLTPLAPIVSCFLDILVTFSAFAERKKQ